MGATNIENQEGNNVFDLDPKIAVVEDQPEDVPRETPVGPRVKIVKMPNSIEDPLKKGTQFSFGGWVYQVYDERSRRRKFIQRVGKIEIIGDGGAPAAKEVKEDA